MKINISFKRPLLLVLLAGVAAGQGLRAEITPSHV